MRPGKDKQVTSDREDPMERLRSALTNTLAETAQLRQEITTLETRLTAALDHAETLRRQLHVARGHADGTARATPPVSPPTPLPLPARESTADQAWRRQYGPVLGELVRQHLRVTAAPGVPPARAAAAAKPTTTSSEEVVDAPRYASPGRWARRGRHGSPFRSGGGAIGAGLL